LAVGLLVAASAPQDEAAKVELKKITGTWVMVAGEEKGQKIPEPTIQNARLNIEGDRHTVRVGQDNFNGTHQLDPAKQPKAIDSTDTEGPFKGQTYRGIYKLEGDEFTVCFAPPGKPRPTEFTTKSGTGEILHIWKRAK
jgi:uncharacterized protein (TIGR03067 family)